VSGLEWGNVVGAILLGILGRITLRDPVNGLVLWLAIAGAAAGAFLLALSSMGMD
jgi:hypothetical protein